MILISKNVGFIFSLAQTDPTGYGSNNDDEDITEEGASLEFDASTTSSTSTGNGRRKVRGKRNKKR